MSVMPVPRMAMGVLLMRSYSSGHSYRDGTRRTWRGGEGGPQRGEVRRGAGTGHHDDDVAGPGLREAVQLGGTGVGRPGHQMAVERLGGEAVELGQPLRPSLVGVPVWFAVVTDMHEDHHARRDDIGWATGLHGLTAQGVEGGTALVPGAEQGYPGTADDGGPPGRRRAGATDPQRHPRRGGELAVLRCRAAGAGPCVLQGGDAGIHEATPTVVVDPGPGVLVGVDPHAQSQ